MQFRLWHLLSLMGVIPLACGTLAYATPWSAAVVFSICMGLLLAAVTFSFAARGASQAFWIGFAVFGIGYWVILQSAPLSMLRGNETTWRLQQDGAPLITSQALTWIYFRVLPWIHEQPVLDPAGNLINGSRYPADPEFSRVGHSLFALAAAFLGGIVGASAHSRRKVPE